jgi:DNA-binding response OmpR family regulator
MPLAPKLVLCIGQDGSALASMKEALLAEGFSVLLARNGKEGLFLASNKLMIDAVVVGLEMPDVNVFEVARCVRSLVPTAPVILYSDAPRLILSGLPSFVTDFVTRPNVGELVSVIERHTNGRAGMRRQHAGMGNEGLRR